MLSRLGLTRVGSLCIGAMAAQAKQDGAAGTTTRSKNPPKASVTAPDRLKTLAASVRQDHRDHHPDGLHRLLRCGSSRTEGQRKSAPKTVENELHGQPCEEDAGYPSDNIRSGLPQQPDEEVCRAHRGVGDD